jgi:hypothetical protein
MDNLDKYTGNIGNKTQNKDKQNRNTTKKTKQATHVSQKV